MRHPWEPQISSPTHILGEEETTNFNFFFHDYPGIYGNHRVETVGKRKCSRPALDPRRGRMLTPSILPLWSPRPFLPSHPWPYPQPTRPHFPLLSLSHPTHRPCAPENSSLPQGLLQHSFEQGHVSKVLVPGCLPSWHHTYHFFMQGLLDLWAL